MDIKRYNQLIKTIKELHLCCKEQDCIQTIEDSNIVLGIIVHELNLWILENERKSKN